MTTPLISQLIDSFRCLPGVGPKSAQRMAFHILERDRHNGMALSKALATAIDAVGYCSSCRTLSETEHCDICLDPKRDAHALCVVETPADVIAIEQTGSFRGYYFVLMGHLSPLDGIGPEQIGIAELLTRVKEAETKELILATNPTVEGEATAHYIVEQVKYLGVDCSRIAYGVPLGGELEYLDGGTVARAFSARTRLHTPADDTIAT